MHSLFIAPAKSAEWFNAQADLLGNDGPALVMALSANGNVPATHGWCGVQLSQEMEGQVAALLAANPDKGVDWTRYDLATQPDWPATCAAELNLKVIQGEMP